jgi:hypothetical protein
MSGYRDNDKLAALDRQTRGWRTSHYGFGALAISLGVLVAGGSVVLCIALAAIGTALVWYGWRNPD